MPRPVHFEIHATDPDRLMRFYETLFGWRFQRAGEMEYWSITTGEHGPDPAEWGINGGLTKRLGPAPGEGAPVNGANLIVGVSDADDTFRQAVALGAAVALEPMTMPGVGRLAYVRDLDGNVIGVIAPDPASMPDRRSGADAARQDDARLDPNATQPQLGADGPAAGAAGPNGPTVGPQTRPGQ